MGKGKGIGNLGSWRVRASGSCGRTRVNEKEGKGNIEHTHCHDRRENIKRKFEDLQVRASHFHKICVYSPPCCRGPI